MKENVFLLICVILLCLRCTLGAADKEEKRCTHKKGTVLKKNFFFGEHELTFKIEVTRRISHQLVSHIARILLKEALGYQRVELVPEDTDNAKRTLEKISSCKRPGSCTEKDPPKGPTIMMNLELWLTPGFNLEEWITTNRIEDCGPLGPIGRAGWFIDKRVVDAMWEKNATVIDHYRAFLNTEVTEAFDLSSDHFVIILANKTCQEWKDAKYNCGLDGIYRPPQCVNTDVKCATLLSDYPQSTFPVLQEAILRYKLFVNVAWLGNKFMETVLKMIGSGPEKRNVLFYHKKPMVYTAIGRFTHVNFPDCEENLSQCEFEVNQLQKVVWGEIKRSALMAYELIRAMSFTQTQYEDLLYSYYTGYNRGMGFEQIACDWVDENEITWIPWIPKDAGNKTNLFIGGIFPITGVYWQQNAVVEAAKMAAKAINTHETLLKDYNMEILESDGHCATDEVMKSFIQYVKSDRYKNTVGILGPACSDTVEPIAGVANHFSTIIISYSAEGTLFNNQERYRFFFRTIPENNIFRYVFIKLLEKLGYHRLAALTEDGQKYPEYLSYLQVLMKNHEMTFIENRKFPRERAFTNMSMYLEDLNNKGARIIIGDFYDYAARSVMCTAYRLRMTAANGYIWFLPSWFPSDWYDTDKINKLVNTTEKVSCTTDEMIEAINGHLSLAHKFYAEDNSSMQENITVKEWLEEYKECVSKENKTPSNYGGYAYDAVWVYALALDKLLKENESHIATLHSPRTSRRLVELLRETHFDGVTGPLFFQNGSRVSDVLIWQWVNQTRHLVGIYRPTSPDDGELELNDTQIKWLTPNGQKPDDGTPDGSEYCEVEALRVFLGGVKCDMAKIFANIFGVSSFIILVIFGIIIYKRRYDRRLIKTKKRMMGLLANNVPYELDKWELPRQTIVINRKLGEGAFGTVYGGEALVGDQGWVAVAIKTLKKGSKIDQKLDFLGEAEVMKQFDHVNIIKLVGVCTTEEPVYTVMEFMLYGDLKTYLLSRRHLVSENDRTRNEEICDRRLTNMALDIARGLSYLADLKYIHRDLACRNCLVNTSRSVKIADFGLCRAMYDSNYYRYSKKSMLPVRWMAPESLIDGLFTPLSDVWSYGVVLYEILTFGSNPYKGFTDDQVLAYVKSYNTLPIPKGCKPALERLLHQCWAKDPHARPQAAAIVEYLAQDPELLTPCLDVPATTDLEDLDTLAFKALDRARGHSFSAVQGRKNAQLLLDPSHLGIFDTSHIAQAGLETVHSTRHSAFKHPNKKSLHESFKKAKRDLLKDKTSDYLPQVTYL